MRKLRDQGMTGLAALIIVVLVAIAAIAGWIWYSKNHHTQTATKAPTAKLDISGKPTATSNVFNPLLLGWVEYRNDQLGFRFAYPQQWGAITTTDPGPGYKLIGSTDNFSDNTADIVGQLSLFVEPISGYTLMQKNSVTIKPASNSTGWQVTEVNPAAEGDYKVGQAYSLQTKQTVNGGTAYVVKYNDESCTLTRFVMLVKGNVVDLTIPTLCASDPSSTVPTENQLAYDQLISQITHTITLY